MTTSYRLGAWALLCALVLAGSANGQGRVQHKVHHYDLSSASDKASKSQTMDPTFTAAAPLGFPRNGVSFQIDYEIIFTADNPTERIDYFAFHAPEGWTITGIGSMPSVTADDCEDNPHTGLALGFSDSSAYWGGNYGEGSALVPGDPATYPDINNRSGCGVWETELTPAAADTHTFSVTMIPSAPGACPGSTTGALPLCCTTDEVSAGGPPPVGSEPYFNEMIAASDANATVFGDGFYYVSLQCPSPFVALDKFPVDAPVDSEDCENLLLSATDTLTVPIPPGDQAQLCYAVGNLSSLISDPWFHVECDSISVTDDVLGSILAGPLTLSPGDLLFTQSNPVDPPSVDQCDRDIGLVACGTAEGSDYISGEGIATGISNIGFSQPDSAWICSVSSLPVELTHFGVMTEDRDLVLQWTTASETNNSGFSVEHRLADELIFREAGFVDGAGTSESVQNYSFRIVDPGPGRHAVRLKQIDFDGAVTFSSVLLTEVEVPGDYYLTAAYPNPFTTTAKAEFAVPTAQDIVLDLVDVQGRTVQTLFDGRLDANARRAVLIDASGLASGTYFLRMSGERFRTSEMVTIAK